MKRLNGKKNGEKNGKNGENGEKRRRSRKPAIPTKGDISCTSFPTSIFYVLHSDNVYRFLRKGNVLAKGAMRQKY